MTSITGITKSECIESPRCNVRGIGYTNLSVNGKNAYAHRLVYLIFKGRIPRDMCVLHTCDNPACVNPNHLYLGTRKKNMEDMYVKGRRPTNLKLTEEQVREIRKRGSHSWKEDKKLAEEYGVGPLSIYNIVSGRSWKGVV